ITAAEEELADARTARRDAEDFLRQTLRDADQAEEALAWLQQRTAKLSERETALKDEAMAALAELQAAQKERSSQPDGEEQQKARARLQDQRDTARQQVMSSQAALSGLNQKLAQVTEQKAVAAAQIKS